MTEIRPKFLDSPVAQETRRSGVAGAPFPASLEGSPVESLDTVSTPAARAKAAGDSSIPNAISSLAETLRSGGGAAIADAHGGLDAARVAKLLSDE